MNTEATHRNFKHCKKTVYLDEEWELLKGPENLSVTSDLTRKILQLSPKEECIKYTVVETSLGIKTYE